MDTRQLECFLRIVERRSISRAALSLGISQPSLSQQLLRLEDELGVKLFHRAARGVTITEAGRLFEEHARHMLQSNEQALEALRGLRTSAMGQVTLGAPPSVLRLIGVPLYEALARHAPLVSLRVAEAFTANIFSALERDKIDLGILYDLGPRPKLSSRRLASEELYLITPPDASALPRPTDEATALDIEAFGRLSLVLPGQPHALRQLLEREAARLDFRLNVVHEVDSLDQIVALVARGHGYTILPRAPVEADVAAGRLGLRRIGDGALRRTLCLARNLTRTVTHASVVTEDLNARVMLELIDSGAWDADPRGGLRQDTAAKDRPQ
jgi:LysR family nitrogen assimilation transcriptional regulator